MRIDKAMGRVGMQGSAISALFLLALMICAVWPAASVAASGLVFDPTLSLTGGCTEPSTLDPEPDPSCPGGPLPPSGSFAEPTSIASDSYGNIYVASFGQANDGSEGRIDIFDSSGFFLTEIPDHYGPRSLVVDSAGTLYVGNGIDSAQQERRLVRYMPTGPYNPASGEITYGEPPEVVCQRKNVCLESPAPLIGIAVNPANDHLFVYRGVGIIEFGSSQEGNPELEEFGNGALSPPAQSVGIAVDAARHHLYVNGLIEETIVNSGKTEVVNRAVVKVFELSSPHKLVSIINGSTTPAGKFSSSYLSLGVDEGNGHVFVYDGLIDGLYELTESGEYVGTLDHGFQHPEFVPELGVDNGAHSPNGALNPRGRYLYVPSNPSGIGHSYAFGPRLECEPTVTSPFFAEVGETEAELGATVDPCHLATTYVVKLTTEERFKREGFSGAQVAGSGQLLESASKTKVSVTAVGLLPGTSYRYRVIANNELGSDEAEGSFNTYPAEPNPEPEPCPNVGVRSGLSSNLPDCRAYELVTPPNTDARSPLGLGTIGAFFPTWEASPAGDKVSFRLEGGTIPGIGGTGSVNGDPYLSKRGPAGWSTVYAGPSPSEAPAILTGSHSVDQEYAFWDNAGTEGSTAVNGEPSSYVRYPDGHSALVGRGSLGIDPKALGYLISEGGGHIIFASGPNSIAVGSAVQLEPNAPPDGTWAIYDRTSDEVTHVVSLLPGDVTPSAGQNAEYEGASLDGKGVAFLIGPKLYLRYDNQKTYEVGEGVTFEGVAEGGGRVFYLEGGNLFRFDAQTKVVTPFTVSGDIIPVNISKDGSTAYFVSPSVLTEASNSHGDKAVKGGENLYLSREGAISFVGTVTERDVLGENLGGVKIDGLGLWTAAISAAEGPVPGRLGADPSRTTADGSVLLFESRANLTGYDSGGHSEIYRYDTVGNELSCLSCNPTGAAAGGDATLQPMRQNGDRSARSTYMLVNNLMPDGRRAFFQSSDALVPADTDQLQDVYEWEDEGVGTCKRAGGCIFLISSGHSHRDNYLHGVSESGNDVFFVAPDLLLSIDSDETPSIYDARVEGGFPSQVEPVCEGEGCRPGLTPPPPLPTPTTTSAAPGKGRKVTHCPKGKRRVKRSGKVRCLKRRHHRHHHKKGVAR